MTVYISWLWQSIYHDNDYDSLYIMIMIMTVHSIYNSYLPAPYILHGRCVMTVYQGKVCKMWCFFIFLVESIYLTVRWQHLVLGHNVSNVYDVSMWSFTSSPLLITALYKLTDTSVTIPTIHTRLLDLFCFCIFHYQTVIAGSTVT